MIEVSTKTTFIFQNKAEQLYPLHSEIIVYLIAAVKLTDDQLLKIKIVLTELLTNAIKHSGCNETLIQVDVDAGTLLIRKTDIGNGFTAIIDDVRHEWPLPGRHVAGKMIHIYGDDIFLLKANIENNLKLKFLVDENHQSHHTNAPDNISEHFGLMIITRACDTFSYEFDIDACSNNFTAAFKL